MNLTDLCIRKPVLAWMIMAAVIALGIGAFTRIGISQFPNIDIPTLTVNVTWEAAAPEVIETDVVDLLEEAFTQVEGVAAIRSASKQGAASITLEMDMARDIDAAFQDVQAKISQVQRRLPKDIDPPTISKVNLDDQPIMWLALSGPFPQQVLSDVARYQLKERLQTVPGVGEIMLGGWLERNVRIWLDADKLNARNLSVGEVVAALGREHVELPAGQLIAGGREVNVRILGEAMNLDTLRQLVIADRGGAPVRMQDVALVEDGFEDVRTLARFNGEPAQGLGIKKQRGTNAVSVADGVNKTLAALRPTLPPGMSVQINYDSTTYIRDSVHELQYELVQAILLTGVLCWIFLGSFSSTLNVILAIPMSLMGTIAVLHFCGFTLNTFTLLGLGLAVGIVVDDAIMVLENITRHREEGEDQVTAARVGTMEIAFAALASTIAVVAVFSPVLFMGGLQGRFFLQFGVALCVAVLFSYLEAVTLAPSRCAQFLAVNEQRSTFIGRIADNLFRFGERLYARILAVSLHHPWKTLLGMVLLFGASIFAATRIPGEFVPPQDQGTLLVRFETAVGSSLAETDRITAKGETIVRNHPEVARVLALVGMTGGSGVNSGIMFISMTPKEARTVSQDDLANALRKELNTIPGFSAKVQDLSARAFTAQRGYPIEFSLRGSDWNGLLAASQDLRQRMNDAGLFVDIDTDAKLGMPELHILPNRERCADLGIPIEDVATAINALVGGVKAGKFTDNGRRLDIRVRLLADQRSRPEDMDRLRLRTASGQFVPLSSLITTEELPAQQTIYRAERERAVGIFANIAPGHSQGECLQWLDQAKDSMPGGVRLVATGSSAAFKSAMGDFALAFGGGLLAAYMVLAAQFNSFVHPITVLSVLPLSITGALVALWATGMSLNLFSVIGILLLMGIAKKNSIILVDYANQLRDRAANLLSPADAMRQAGPIRLRPILMTSLATMLAAVPLAIGLGPGSEIRKPMAMAVIGGVFISTVLSLVVVPAFYVVIDRFRRHARPTPPGHG
jgi:hydrophobe/amphiphile efflux-1 (HAE1) family protein